MINSLISCAFSLFKVGIFYCKLILRKTDFKFSPTKNLFRLFKAIERDCLINLYEDILFYDSHNGLILEFLLRGKKTILQTKFVTTIIQ